jgi:hypothetical protein
LFRKGHIRRRRALIEDLQEASQLAVAWLRAGQHSGLEAEPPSLKYCSAAKWTIPLLSRSLLVMPTHIGPTISHDWTIPLCRGVGGIKHNIVFERASAQGKLVG